MGAGDVIYFLHPMKHSNCTVVLWAGFLLESGSRGKRAEEWG